MIRLPFILASGFVASETIEGTLPVLRSLQTKGLRATVDFLGEHVTKPERATEGLRIYARLLRTLAQDTDLDNNISIKLSMIGQMIDEDLCITNLRKLLEVARATQGFVRLDMEDSSIIDSTLRIFDAVHTDYPDYVGVVLQAYMKRTRKDVERMCERKARVRLCKGAYKEPPHLAYQSMNVIQERYIEYMQLLLRHGTYPGIATHDDRLIRATQRFARKEGIAKENFEFQMLYRFRPHTQEDIVRSGYNMRVYVPFGRDWLPYYTRRLRERKENVFFLFRNMFRK